MNLESSRPSPADTESPEAVVRHVLSSAHPASAPGETLELVQYIIPAGAELPVHTHPGVQMATVESGALTYHVVDHGQATLTRADGTESVLCRVVMRLDNAVKRHINRGGGRELARSLAPASEWVEMAWSPRIARRPAPHRR